MPFIAPLFVPLPCASIMQGSLSPSETPAGTYWSIRISAPRESIVSVEILTFPPLEEIIAPKKPKSIIRIKNRINKRLHPSTVFSEYFALFMFLFFPFQKTYFSIISNTQTSSFTKASNSSMYPISQIGELVPGIL